MDGTPPRVFLVVVNYGSSHLLLQNLARSADDPELGVVVVDNYSTPEERRRVESLTRSRGWDLVAPAQNVGFGGGMNLGIEQALARGAQVVAMLNPDLVIAPDDVLRLVAVVRADPDALVAPRILAPDGRPFAAGISDLLMDDGTMRASARRPDPPDGRPFREWLSGACLVIGADLWRRTGGFDDEYFLYWEDVDFSRRVQQCGGSLAVVDDVAATHEEGGTQGRTGRAKTETYYYWNIRNRFMYAARWLDAEEQRRWRRATLTATYAVLAQGGRRQFVSSWSPWRSAWRGVRDGRRLMRSAAVGSP
ncbi:glycosyltransferase family 2 protein [Cellulomonas rhizosphaerae]|uniref:Glycosyltransferase family 2 protein n=1 Tax=Cellulomonas rhizosphaerae TaxID=2293719 RepID=A0A413RNE1_9CELL|nr:glycosyltransferase family 2 protein [Cellulomonas rhizosphaerae]